MAKRDVGSLALTAILAGEDMGKFVSINCTGNRVFALDDLGRIWELDIVGEWKPLPPVPMGKEQS